jgi:large subunit ribosomal protein L21
MYAVVISGGKQYRVSKGEIIRVEKLDAEVGAVIDLGDVLFIENEGALSIGKPVLEGAKVTAKVLAQDKAKKIEGFKYKAKKNYRRRWGHRQPYTKLQIEAIEA